MQAPSRTAIDGGQEPSPSDLEAQRRESISSVTTQPPTNPKATASDAGTQGNKGVSSAQRMTDEYADIFIQEDKPRRPWHRFRANPPVRLQRTDSTGTHSTESTTDSTPSMTSSIESINSWHAVSTQGDRQSSRAWILEYLGDQGHRGSPFLRKDEVLNENHRSPELLDMANHLYREKNYTFMNFERLAVLNVVHWQHVLIQLDEKYRVTRGRIGRGMMVLVTTLRFRWRRPVNTASLDATILGSFSTG